MASREVEWLLPPPPRHTYAIANSALTSILSIVPASNKMLEDINTCTMSLKHCFNVPEDVWNHFPFASHCQPQNVRSVVVCTIYLWILLLTVCEMDEPLL